MEISIYKRSKPFSSNERGWWWMGNRSSLPATLPPQNLLRGLRKHLKLSLQGSNWGFSGGSEGKDSACNAEDLGSIPGLERSPGEENGYHSSILDWGILWTKGARQATVHGVTESQT